MRMMIWMTMMKRTKRRRPRMGRLSLLPGVTDCGAGQRHSGA
jgi:hypothetical protein